MRLIEADALIDALNRQDIADWLSEQDEYTPASIVKHAMETLPTVDAVPVRHGHWTVTRWFVQCSECGEAFPLTPTNYCPHCGAKMDAEREEG